MTQAIGYWQRAGQQAIERSANLEAISHLTKGLEVLQALPETPSASSTNSRCTLALGAPLHRHERLCCPGSSSKSTPEPGSYVSRWGDAPALSQSCLDCGSVLCASGRSTRQRASWREQFLNSGPTCPSPGTPPARPTGRLGGRCVLAWRVCPSPSTLGAGDCPLRHPAAPFPVLLYGQDS